MNQQENIGTCPTYGKQLERKSDNGRSPKYCSTGCRVKAWRAAQKQKAGGAK